MKTVKAGGRVKHIFFQNGSTIIAKICIKAFLYISDYELYEFLRPKHWF